MIDHGIHKMDNVLVTCVGSGVGQSVVDSLVLAQNFTIFGCDGNRDVYVNRFCSQFIESPSIYSDDYINFLIETCTSNRISLIIPGHDYELSLLSKNISIFKENDIHVTVSENSLVEVSRDKYKWYEYFSKLGCPIVPTYRVSSFLDSPDTSIFPAIIKPTGGSASQGISIVSSMDELIKGDHGDNIIQPYLFPTQDDPNYKSILKAVERKEFIQVSEMSIQLIFSRDSVFKGMFVSENILKNGIPVCVNPISASEFKFRDDVMKFVPYLVENGARGPVNIQGRMTEKGLMCFEMNMRFTGITGTRALQGFNEVEYVTSDFLGKEIELCEPGVNKIGVRQVACSVVPRVALRNSRIRITVLGGGGHIGSHCVHEILKMNAYGNVTLICRESSLAKYQELFTLDGSVEVLSDTSDALQSAYCKTDVLINFVGALAYEDDETKFSAIDYQYDQYSLIKKANIPLIINISSQSVYDQRLNIAKDESCSVKIDGTYAHQKYFGEKLFASIEDDYPSTRTISLRVSRVIGPHASGKKSKGFFYSVISSFLKNNPISLPHPNNNTNLVDIRDLCGFICYILENRNTIDFPKLINVGSDNLSVSEYCRKVAQVLGIENAQRLIEASDKTEITSSSMIDCTLLRSTGWERAQSVESTILDMKNELVQGAEKQANA